MNDIVMHNLTFSYMYSYGEDNSLELDKNRITQLNAPNGYGKTSIPLIIQELLQSRNIKKIKKGDILHRYAGSDTWEGSLSFTVNGVDEYKIEVKRKGVTSKVALYQNGKDISEHKVPDTYKKLTNDILKMDFDVFCQLIYQSGTDVLKFLKATDSERKKFLINLFNLEKYIVAGESIKVLVSQTEKELTTISAEYNNVTAFLNETTIPEYQDTIDIPEIPDELIAAQAQLEQTIASHKEQSTKIDKNNLLIQELNSLRFDMSMVEPDLTKLNERVGKLQSAKTVRETNINQINSNINSIKNKIKELNLADKCYACNQPIDNSMALKMKEDFLTEIKNLEISRDLTEAAELKTITEALVEVNKSLEQEKQKLIEYNNNKKNIERFEQLNQLIDRTLPITHNDITELQNNLKLIKEELSTAKELRNNAIDFNQKVGVNNAKVDALKEQKRNYLARKEILESKIDKLNIKLSRLTILRKAFSSTGIVAFKLENLIKSFENEINNYLDEFSDGQFQLSFRLEGEKLNIVIVDSAKEAPIETISAGEYSRIQTSVLLAIRKLLTHIGNSNINILFLDEIDGGLDNAGKEKLLEVLSREEKLNIFLVSHSFTHPLLEQINIIKEGKISRIE